MKYKQVLIKNYYFCKMKKLVLLIALYLIRLDVNAQECFVKKDTIKLNKQNVYELIKKNNILYSDIVFAQSILESGNYKSSICLKNNNLFGMKLPKKRKTLAIGSKNGYAKYNNWIDSIEDYKIWQDNLSNSNKLSKENYLIYLTKKYSKYNNEYVKNINLIIKQYNRLFTK